MTHFEDMDEIKMGVRMQLWKILEECAHKSRKRWQRRLLKCFKTPGALLQGGTFDSLVLKYIFCDANPGTCLQLVRSFYRHTVIK